MNEFFRHSNYGWQSIRPEEFYRTNSRGELQNSEAFYTTFDQVNYTKYKYMSVFSLVIYVVFSTNWKAFDNVFMISSRLTFTYSDLITSKGLSISIGPSIIRIERHFENLDHRAEHFSIMNNYLDYLIQYSDYIFPQMAIISTEV